jgi:hypothetical protein
MEFTLVYQGPLKANGSIEDKQNIRREFHSQLKELWKQEPLSGHVQGKFNLLENIVVVDNPPDGSSSIVQTVNGFRFVPLVCSKLCLIAELSITFLRPEPPGRIVTQGGDIDNRLKTLFDALRMPKEEKEIPKGDIPGENENPFFCLLEDDNLITKVAVATDRLLKPCDDSSFVNLLIAVQTKATRLTWGNIDLA